MKKFNYLSRSFINAAGTFAYIFIIVWLGSHSQQIIDQSNSFLTPVFMLLLFVVSASITGLLVLGKPVLLYLGGFKKEAFALLFATLAWLILFLIIIAIVLIAKKLNLN